MDWRAEAQRLQQQLEERDIFLAVVAHELRNPMHSLSLQLTVAQLEARKQGAAAVTGRIEKAQEILQRYIEHATLLLDLARVSGGRSAARRPGDLAELLRRLAEDLRAQAQHHGITLQLDLPQHCLVAFDIVAVEHVASNFLVNACLHSGGTTVRLQLKEGADAVSVVVADDGRGIPATDRDRIFGKFERGGRSPNGSGLGLWISRLLAQQLGGSISLEDGPEGGSVFNLRIPLQR